MEKRLVCQAVGGRPEVLAAARRLVEGEYWVFSLTAFCC
jgi:hypothetical protein